MKKILIIQSRRRSEMVAAEQGEYVRAVENLAQLDFVSTLDTLIPWNEPEKIIDGYDGIILGGSGEFDLDGGRTVSDPAQVKAREILDRLRPLISYTLRNEIHVLGICFGHQLIAEACGGKVQNDYLQKKIGSFPVQLNQSGKDDSLLQDLPKSLVGQYGHKDSVTTLPKEATIIMESPQCRFSGLRYGSRVYTFQFHPELTAEDVKWKLANSPGYLPEGVLVESIVQESPDASRIIPLWIERIISDTVREDMVHSIKIHKNNIKESGNHSIKS